MLYAALDAVKEKTAREYADILNKQKGEDLVNAPPHYRSHPSGVECIQITEHMGFNLGNAVKYIWRADLKGNSIQDLEKAVWYVQREIQLRIATSAKAATRASSTHAGTDRA